ncbi:MAG: hypothetical protein KC609_10540 [Myxococcales bacterium]|nr:hypothetical protein [Myxococcales bacterium]
MATATMYVEDTLKDVESRLVRELGDGESFDFLGTAEAEQNLTRVYLLALLIFVAVITVGGFAMSRLAGSMLRIAAIVVTLGLAVFAVATFLSASIKSYFVGRTNRRLLLCERGALLRGERMNAWGLGDVDSVLVSWRERTPHVEIRPRGAAPIRLAMAWLAYAEMRDPRSRLAKLSTVGQLSANIGDGTDDDVMEAELVE